MTLPVSTRAFDLFGELNGHDRDFGALTTLDSGKQTSAACRDVIITTRRTEEASCKSDSTSNTGIWLSVLHWHGLTSSRGTSMITIRLKSFTLTSCSVNGCCKSRAVRLCEWASRRLHSIRDNIQPTLTSPHSQLRTG